MFDALEGTKRVRDRGFLENIANGRRALHIVLIENERRMFDRLPDGEGNKDVRCTPLDLVSTFLFIFISILILNSV